MNARVRDRYRDAVPLQSTNRVTRSQRQGPRQVQAVAFDRAPPGHNQGPASGRYSPIDPTRSAADASPDPLAADEVTKKHYAEKYPPYGGYVCNSVENELGQDMFDRPFPDLGGELNGYKSRFEDIAKITRFVRDGCREFQANNPELDRPDLPFGECHWFSHQSNLRLINLRGHTSFHETQSKIFQSYAQPSFGRVKIPHRGFVSDRITFYFIC